MIKNHASQKTRNNVFKSSRKPLYKKRNNLVKKRSTGLSLMLGDG